MRRLALWEGFTVVVPCGHGAGGVYAVTPAPLHIVPMILPEAHAENRWTMRHLRIRRVSGAVETFSADRRASALCVVLKPSLPRSRIRVAYPCRFVLPSAVADGGGLLAWGLGVGGACARATATRPAVVSEV